MPTIPTRVTTTRFQEKKAVPKDGELPNIIGTLERTPKIEEQLRIIAFW